MKRIMLWLATMAGLAAIAHAQPAYMNYQGRLLDAAGQPLTNGAYTLEFNLYDAPDGATTAWGPFLCDDGMGDGHTARAVVANGRFNIILGPSDTAGRALTDAFQEDARFMEIKVNGGPPILPRQQVLSAPFAIQSHSAQQADVASSLVQQVADLLCPPGSIVAFGGSHTNVPAGWLLCDGSELESAAFPRLYGAIGTAWGGGPTSFRLPDLRGVFLRGVNLNRTDAFSDPNAETRIGQSGGNTGNQVGSYQSDNLQSHRHQWGYYSGADLWSWDSNGNGVMALNRAASNQIPSGSGKDDDYMDVMNVGGGFWTQPVAPTTVPTTETRSRNAYVNYIIKY